MRNTALGIVWALMFVTPCFLLAQENYWESYLADTGTTEDQWQKYQTASDSRAQEAYLDLDRRLKQEFPDVRKTGEIEEYNHIQAREQLILTDEVYRIELANHFSPKQVANIQLRGFQSYFGIMKGLDKTDDKDVICDIDAMTMLVPQSYTAPDFLELSPAQKEEIHKIHQESLVKGTMMREEFVTEFMEKNPDIHEKMQNPESGGSLEQQQELMIQLVNMMDEYYRDQAPRLKKLILERNQKYMALMTDAQKAKIEKVMDDVPDYIWKTFPTNHDKDRPWRPGQGSWMPGMGVPPNLENLNRESRPPRPEGKKTFPGQEEE